MACNLPLSSTVPNAPPVPVADLGIMQNRIAYHILSLLYLNGKVRVPGLGRIQHTLLKARVNDGSLNPPQHDTRFQAGKSGKGSLLEKFVAYKAETSRTQARRDISAFSKEVRSGISTDGKVALKDFGVFSIEGDNIVFTPDERVLNPGSTSLSPVDLPDELRATDLPDSSIPVATEAKSFTPEVQEHDDQDHKLHSESEDEVEGQPAPIEVIPIAEPPEIMPYLPIIQPVKESSPVANANTNTDTNTNANTNTNTEDEHLKEDKKAVAAVAIPPVATKGTSKEPPKEERDISVALPIIGLIVVGLLIAAFLFYQSRDSRQDSKDAYVSGDTPTAIDQTQETNSNSTTAEPGDVEGQNNVAPETPSSETIATETPVNPPVEQSPEVETPADTESNSDNQGSAGTEQVEEQSSVQVATGDCIIVLGAFSQSSNVDRMAERLRDMGYTITTRSSGSLMQVGVPVDCKARNLNVVLDFLRQNVEPEAWVRIPR